MSNVVQKPAIEVTPGNHALWCSVEGLNKGEPFANAVEYRTWSEDGSEILFGLDTHNGFSAKPDQLMSVVELKPGEHYSQEHLAKLLKKDTERMANKPVPMIDCSHCKGKGKLPQEERQHDDPPFLGFD
jgi:hypothetical protein